MERKLKRLLVISSALVALLVVGAARTVVRTPAADVGGVPVAASVSVP